MTKRPGAVMMPGSPTVKSFTIVELLVSIAILSILVIVLLSMLTSLMTVWQAGQAHNERRTIAQAVLDRMTRDLSQVALPLSRTSTNELQMIINPTGVSATYQYPHAIFCQAPVATDNGTSGNLAVVGYFIQWVNGSPGTPCMSRILINPSSADYKIYSAPNAWISDALLASDASATSPSYAGLLSENVLGLWVQALDPLGNPIQQQTLPAGETFDSKYPYAYTNFSELAPVPLETNMSSAPASLQIAIAVIDSRTAKYLTAKPSYPTTNAFWNNIQNFYTNLPPLIQKGTEIQTTVVTLPNAPR
jgi:type II secretory pathway component PulJ